jgi:hypothetical protein
MVLGAVVTAGGTWVAGIVVAFGAVMAYSGFRTWKEQFPHSFMTSLHVARDAEVQQEHNEGGHQQ